MQEMLEGRAAKVDGVPPCRQCNSFARVVVLGVPKCGDCGLPAEEPRVWETRCPGCKNIVKHDPTCGACGVVLPPKVEEAGPERVEGAKAPKGARKPVKAKAKAKPRPQRKPRPAAVVASDDSQAELQPMGAADQA